jgi:hypothetical protein
MTWKKCSHCLLIYPDEELLTREDNGEQVCEECSGLRADEDLSCCYDEW